MADVQNPGPAASATSLFSEETVFKIFSEPIRRNLLSALIREGHRTAAMLHPVRFEHHLHNVVTHLRVMRDGGFATMTANPSDGRRALYSLTPQASAMVSKTGGEFVFRFPSMEVQFSFADFPNAEWKEKVVFPMLADGLRRRMFLSLVRGGPQPAIGLQGASGRSLDTTLKRLASMRNAGFVTMQENPKDRRRSLYALTPKVPVSATESGKVIDFGYCVLRLF